MGYNFKKVVVKPLRRRSVFILVSEIDRSNLELTVNIFRKRYPHEIN